MQRRRYRMIRRIGSVRTWHAGSIRNTKIPPLHRTCDTSPTLGAYGGGMMSLLVMIVHAMLLRSVSALQCRTITECFIQILTEQVMRIISSDSRYRSQPS